jgi:hypothetical protein
VTLLLAHRILGFAGKSSLGLRQGILTEGSLGLIGKITLGVEMLLGRQRLLLHSTEHIES